MSESKNQLKQEFIVNNFITVKLEDNKTVIYIDGKPFRQCKYLLLNIPIDKISAFEDIESIDEASEKLNTKLEEDITPDDLGLSPEEEFWGHCSNLQAWAENDYDTRLLHRSLAFPLLKKLVDVGDPTAKRVKEAVFRPNIILDLYFHPDL
ncbi:MAG: hypothetical protein ACTSPD_04670 [Promethearchaeota archaeon]